MLDLNSPAFYIEADHQGRGADKAESKDAGNLSRSLPMCIGARVMLTRNLWTATGLCNGSQGTVHGFGWAEGADPQTQPPLVIMVAFDKGITLSQAVCDISEPEFSTGLSYVAVSRVSTLEGLMFDAPFDRRQEGEHAARTSLLIEHGCIGTVQVGDSVYLATVTSCKK